jgi:hypothetical protein
MVRLSPRSPRTCGVLVLLASAALVAATSPAFLALHEPDEIRAGSGVTRSYLLSEYLPALRGTAGDTPVFELSCPRPGATVLVLGGTHGDEVAGYLAAVVLVESARVEAGRLLVIPRANASGFTHNMPQEAHPQHIAITTARGSRRFTVGARATNPVHQWPDPQVYTLRESGQALSGLETRNLNRAYPGHPDGPLTERIAYAITTMIRAEKVDLAIDLHEAAPEYPVVNTIVAHERAADLAALANMNLQGAGIQIGLESSPLALHGLSHREWGDATSTLAILMETANPAQGRLRGRTDAELVIAGRDHYYERAARRGQLSVPFDSDGWPIAIRVGRHLAGVSALADAFAELNQGRTLVLRGVPTLAEVRNKGVGAFLR